MIFSEKIKRKISAVFLGIMLASMAVALVPQKTQADSTIPYKILTGAISAGVSAASGISGFLYSSDAPQGKAECGLVGTALRVMAGDAGGWLLNAGNALNNLIGCAVLAVGNVVLYAETTILNWVVNLLDIVVDVSIRNFAQYVPRGGGVEKAWQAGRNMANLFFIFILIYAAIGIMLDLPSISGKGYIMRILIVAVFINFSFTGTRFVIDVTNVTANEIINQMFGQGDSTFNYKDRLGEYLYRQLAFFPYSNPYVAALATSNGDTDTLRSNYQSYIEDTKLDIFSAGISVVGAMLMVLAVALVLLAGCFFLFLRTIALMFSLALAPLAFLTYLFPKFDYMGEWWKTLVNNAIFAPAYVFMLYVALQASSGANAALTTATGVAGNGGTAELFGAKFSQTVGFIIYIGLIAGSIEMARRLSMTGADAALGYYNSILKGAGKLVAQPATRGGELALNTARTRAAERAENFIKNGGATRLRNFSPYLGQSVETLASAVASSGRSAFNSEKDRIKNRSTAALNLVANDESASRTERLAAIQTLVERGNLKGLRGNASTIALLSELPRLKLQKDDKEQSYDALAWQHAQTPDQWAAAVGSLPKKAIEEGEVDELFERANLSNPNVMNNIYQNFNGDKFNEAFKNATYGENLLNQIIQDYEQTGGPREVEAIKDWAAKDAVSENGRKRGSAGLATFFTNPGVLLALRGRNFISKDDKPKDTPSLNTGSSVPNKGSGSDRRSASQ